MVLRHIETYWDPIVFILMFPLNSIDLTHAPMHPFAFAAASPQSFAPRHGAWHSTLELGQEEIASLEVLQFAFQSNVGNGKSPRNEGFNWNIPIIISYWFLFYVVLVVWPIPVWLTALFVWLTCAQKPFLVHWWIIIFPIERPYGNTPHSQAPRSVLKQLMVSWSAPCLLHWSSPEHNLRWDLCEIALIQHENSYCFTICMKSNWCL